MNKLVLYKRSAKKVENAKIYVLKFRIITILLNVFSRVEINFHFYKRRVQNDFSVWSSALGILGSTYFLASRNLQILTVTIYD